MPFFTDHQGKTWLRHDTSDWMERIHALHAGHAAKGTLKTKHAQRRAIAIMHCKRDAEPAYESLKALPDFLGEP